ncbi:hypothetical protein ACM9HF_20455 [Colwellia sp. RE-S-Sl-9]
MGYFFITAICLLAICILIIKRFNKNKIKKTQLLGISYITQLKPLISLVQQHRGLSSAWLNGDITVKPKITSLQKQIANMIKDLKKTELHTNERWVSFNDHWQRLLNLKTKPSVANSFEQHCLLVKNLSYLLEDTSETYLLTAEYCNGFPNIGYTWRELIISTENIGQARAIGTSVCVQKVCSSVDKIRLNFLTENMKKITTNTLHKLHYLSDEVDQHDDYINAATLKMEDFTQVISNDLVNSPTIAIDHQRYFALATSTIAAFDDIFYHQVEQLKKLI